MSGDGLPRLGLWALVRADMAELAKVKAVPFPGLKSTVDLVTLPGFWTVFVYRVAHALNQRGLRPLSRLCYFLNVVVFNVDIAPTMRAGPGLVIPHAMSVAIGGNVVLGARNRVLSHTSIGGSADPRRSDGPVTGDDVWIMDGAKVFGAAEIGDRSIVGAAAIVTDVVPPDMFVFGARRSTDRRPLAELGLADHHLRNSKWELLPDRVLAGANGSGHKEAAPA